MCSLLCTPDWAQTAVFSYLLSLPPALPRTFLHSELSPGSFPLEQLCAALGAPDRLRSFPSSILWWCLTLPTTQSSKHLNSSPPHTSVPRPHRPSTREGCTVMLLISSPLPFSDPMFLEPKAQRFLFILFLCFFFFSTNPEIRHIETGGQAK